MDKDDAVKYLTPERKALILDIRTDIGERLAQLMQDVRDEWLADGAENADLLVALYLVSYAVCEQFVLASTEGAGSDKKGMSN